jgi:hypothetical protein
MVFIPSPNLILAEKKKKNRIGSPFEKIGESYDHKGESSILHGESSLSRILPEKRGKQPEKSREILKKLRQEKLL